MVTFSDLFTGVVRDPSGQTLAAIPDDWMQGRTAYGGLTAALCLHTALPLARDKPIRTMQIAFVGPVSGAVVCQPELLREGKNTAVIRVRMSSGDDIQAEALFAFGAARTSGLNYLNLPAPEVPDPDDIPAYFNEGSRAPSFAARFDIRQAGGVAAFSGASDGDVTLWMRHRDQQAGATPTALVALADVPPPAAIAMLNTPGRMSSMTWMAEFLTSDLYTHEGWYLDRHTAQSAVDGYSSQAMTIWNSSGRPIMTGRQTVTIFD